MRTRRVAARYAAYFLCALASLACSREAKEDRFAGAPVILISIDTLRADHLPAYGYDKVETPNIDALRRDGTLFQNAYAQVPLTLPSHLSLLTGLLPAEHEVRNNVGYRFDAGKHATLQGELKKAGYRTGAAVSAYVLRSGTGIGAGFEMFDDSIASRSGAAQGSLMRPGAVTRGAAERWIDTVGETPFFLLFHIFEPHSPYEPPEPFRSRYGLPYDGEIAASDAIVGQLVDGLKQKGIYDRAIVVLLSDHGEGLGQHGEPEHGIFVYREAVHVPLIVKLPEGARAGQTISQPVALTDIAPTILALAGRPVPAAMKGRSLFAAPPEGAERSIYTESMYGRIHLGWAELRSLIDEEFQFIDAPRPELYSIPRDPAQTTNVLAANRRVYARMKSELTQFASALAAPSSVAAEERAKLAALGYLGSTASAPQGPLPDPKDRIHEIGAMIEATRLMNEGDLDDAVASLRAILAKNAYFSDAWNQLAIALDRAGRYEEAAEAYRKAIVVNPALAGEFALSLAAVLMKLERYDEAVSHARLAEGSSPGQAHLTVARIALARKDFIDAEKEARAASAADPDAALAAKIVIAQVLTQQGRLQEALALADEAKREAISKQLGPLEALEYTRGDILARMDRLPEAEAAFRAEIATFPRNRQPYANLALVLLITGRRAEANALFEELTRQNPGRNSLLFAAKTFSELDDPESAAAWRRRAGRPQ